MDVQRFFVKLFRIMLVASNMALPDSRVTHLLLQIFFALRT